MGRLGVRVKSFTLAKLIKYKQLPIVCNYSEHDQNAPYFPLFIYVLLNNLQNNNYINCKKESI